MLTVASRVCRDIFKKVKAHKQYRTFLELLFRKHADKCFTFIPSPSTTKQTELLIAELVRFLFIKCHYIKRAAPSEDIDMALLSLLSLPKFYADVCELIHAQAVIDYALDKTKGDYLIDYDPLLDFDSHDWRVQLDFTRTQYKKYFPDGMLFPPSWESYEDNSGSAGAIGALKLGSSSYHSQSSSSNISNSSDFGCSESSSDAFAGNGSSSNSSSCSRSSSSSDPSEQRKLVMMKRQLCFDDLDDLANETAAAAAAAARNIANDASSHNQTSERSRTIQHASSFGAARVASSANKGHGHLAGGALKRQRSFF